MNLHQMADVEKRAAARAFVKTSVRVAQIFAVILLKAAQVHFSIHSDYPCSKKGIALACEMFPLKRENVMHYLKNCMQPKKPEVPAS